MNVKIADRVRLAVTIVASLVLAYALFISATHIGHVGHALGLRPFEASTLFILVDIPAVVGKVLRSKCFAASTRRTGFRLLVGSGLVSLGCNVASGWLTGGVGPASYGVFVVLMALLMENVIGKIKPAAAVTKAKNATATATPAPRRKARTTRATRKPKAPAAAPVSPATVAEIEAALSR